MKIINTVGESAKYTNAEFKELFPKEELEDYLYNVSEDGARVTLIEKRNHWPLIWIITKPTAQALGNVILYATKKPKGE